MLSPAAADGSADFRDQSDGLLMMPPVESGSVDTRRWTLIAVCVTTFMLLLDITIVNVASPSIQRGERFRQRTECRPARRLRDRLRRCGSPRRVDARAGDRSRRPARNRRKPRHLRGILSAASFRI